MEPATTDLSISLVEHANFAVSDRAGDILVGSYHGFFVSDTRVLSRLVLRVNGQRLEPLASGGDEHHASRTFYLASPRMRGVPPATISITRDRRIAADLGERIRLVSYAPTPIEVEIGLEVDADFADIFEVRGHRQLRRRVTRVVAARSVRFTYAHRGYRRETKVVLSRSAASAGRMLLIPARLEHGRPWDLRVRITSSLRGPASVRRARPEGRISPDRVRNWITGVPRLTTDDPRLARAWRRGIRDMAALLLVGPAGQLIPAAGLPWFMAIFGRDAAITAMQTLLLGPDIPHGTLHQLAAYQGTVEDRFREEEAGKIPHEVRHGELATLGHIPFGRYYGSVDATPLYLMLFVAAARWSGWLGRAVGTPPPAPLRELLPHAEAALGWIERSVDADGLVWYQPAGRGGIRNQVWKDSNDSMRRADGSLATPPIASVEVQGYVVSARRGMGAIYEVLGRTAEAERQRAEADRLVNVLEAAFWMPSEGTYALGIERGGDQVDGIASNAGHLLWADAIPGERARAVTDRLMAPDMFSGWGIRTLSAQHPAYNPIGYHIGSVWPHDTSLIAYGMARAGHVAEAQRLTDALLDAADADANARLPELFAGFDRSSTPDLVPYPTACAPQAWATGAIFQSVRTLMEIRSRAGTDRWRGLDLESGHDKHWHPPS